jgi:hypothetical protein
VVTFLIVFASVLLNISFTFYSEKLKKAVRPLKIDEVRDDRHLRRDEIQKAQRTIVK